MHVYEAVNDLVKDSGDNRYKNIQTPKGSAMVNVLHSSIHGTLQVNTFGMTRDKCERGRRCHVIYAGPICGNIANYSPKSTAP